MPGGRAVRMVGAPGFEPGTSCSQSRRATRLRHAPTIGGNTRDVNKLPQTASRQKTPSVALQRHRKGHTGGHTCPLGTARPSTPALSRIALEDYIIRLWTHAADLTGQTFLIPPGHSGPGPALTSEARNFCRLSRSDRGSGSTARIASVQSGAAQSALTRNSTAVFLRRAGGPDRASLAGLLGDPATLGQCAFEEIGHAESARASF